MDGVPPGGAENPRSLLLAMQASAMLTNGITPGRSESSSGMAADAASAAICIDSDDEMAQASEDVIQSVLSCQVLLDHATARSKESMEHPVPVAGGHFCIRCVEGFLEVAREGRTPLLQIPTSIVVGFDFLPDGKAVHIKFDAPCTLRKAVPLQEAGGEPSIADTCTAHHAIGLVPMTPPSQRGMLQTLQKWFPKVPIKTPVGMAEGSLNSQGSFSLRLEGIELTEREMVLLRGHHYLNDTVLDFFLRLVMELVAPNNLKDEVYVASSFFFQKLTSNGVASGEEGWENVHRWTRALPGGLLTQRYILVPINEQNIHWWLAVVCHPSTALGSSAPNNGSQAPAGQAPRIVCLDSAVEPPPKDRTVNFLRGYFWREWCERHPEEMSSLGPSARDRIKVERVTSFKTITEADVPKQENGYDCGLFVIEYLVHLLRSRSALASLGLAPHQHWFQQANVSHRRSRLCAITKFLREQAAADNEPDVMKLLQDQRRRQMILRALQDQPKNKKRPPPEASGGGGSTKPRPPAVSSGAGPGAGMPWN